ncbi:MAG TPA: hypothetical protein VMF59_17195, partial [Bacteroidota bacterium]|nr:hypothetical protein [Bacteroidota bacterium]
RSLRFQMQGWNAGRKGRYRLAAGGPSIGLTEGLPVIPAGLSDTYAEVRQAASDAGKGSDDTALRSISRAIARVENRIATRRAELGSLEKRLLITWKERLEDLRCAVLNVDLRFTVSAGVITPRQQFSLRFPPDRKFPRNGSSEIIFTSAIDSTWIINRSEGFRFPFTVPDTLELISPEHMDFNRPVATNGSDKFAVNTRIPFDVVHRDPDPLRNFDCRREMVLGVSPVQSVEILTPFVRVTEGERLVVELLNVSRQPYTGTMGVGDSVAQESKTTVTLPRSDKAKAFVLPLAWRDGIPDGDYRVPLHIGKGRPVGSFTARKFNAVADTSRFIGLLTGIASSPLEDALRRLHVPFRLIAGSFTDTSGAGMRAVLIDRNALNLRPDARGVSARVAAWVRSGGRCVMLRQGPLPPGENPLAEAAGFAAGPVIAPEAGVAAAEHDSLLTYPNPISASDWQNWIISRALSPLRISSGSHPVVHCTDASTGAPLVASVKLGEGTLTVVALDLLPQIQIVHPGAYRLLANLLSY